MRRYVLRNSSKTSVCGTGWKIKDCVNTTSTHTVPYLQQNSLLPNNSTQWLDSLRLSELGVLSLGFTTTARRRLKGRKGFQSLRNTAVRLNIKRAAGSFHSSGKLLPLGTEKIGRAS